VGGANVKRPVVILGGGGHARVVADALERLNRRILGAIARDVRPGTTTAWGLALLGDDETLATLNTSEVELANGVGSTSSTALRTDIFRRTRALGFAYAEIVHPAAVVASGVRIGVGAQIMAGAVVQPGAELGDNVLINTRASIDHDCRIGGHVHVAPGVTLSGGVSVGEGAHIGTGAVVIQSIKIGKGAIIGAGAVICEDVPEGAMIRAPKGSVEKGSAA
jgi:sugar O-acyltransferase (sialic acid O-acetyltransferase NeuD family)